MSYNKLQKVRLGRTELTVTKTAMGCLPIQRCSDADAVGILQRAYEGGINFFDTARAYTDSEHKLGLAFSDVRENVIIATKSVGRDKKSVAADIQTSLERLRTNYIDVFQLHAMETMPDFSDPDGVYAALEDARKAGYIRHIGATTHKLELAFALIETDRFETLQYPFSYLSGDREQELVKKCASLDVGFIAMKALAGGMLTNVRACHAFMAEFPNAVPIWGVQTLEQIEAFLTLAYEDPRMDDSLRAVIDADREQLSGSFCRGCGYCLPCPENIEIFTVARMEMLLRRAPWRQFMTDASYAKMQKIKNCRNCGLCSSRCPYKLDTPAILRHMLEDYNAFYASHKDLV
jgi:predicted aldo/keto reductase-like oxidoreductase